MTKTKTKPVEVKQPKWEIKDKLYELTINETPIVFTLKSKGILLFDEEMGNKR